MDTKLPRHSITTASLLAPSLFLPLLLLATPSLAGELGSGEDADPGVELDSEPGVAPASGPVSPTPAGPAVVATSAEGYTFASIASRNRYDNERVIIEVIDRPVTRPAETTTVTTTGRTRGGGVSVDVGQVAQSAAALAGVPMPFGLSIPVSTRSQRSEATTTQTSSEVAPPEVARTYRLSTGDGIVLCEFDGDRAREPAATLEYVGQPDVLGARPNWTIRDLTPLVRRFNDELRTRLGGS